MHKIIPGVIILIFLIQSGSAQHHVLNNINSVANLGMAGAGVANFQPNHALLNPAHLGLLNGGVLEVNSRNYYLVNGLYNVNMAAAYATQKNGGAGLIIAYDGSKDISEFCAAFQYGRKLSKTTVIGLQFNMLNRRAVEVKSTYGLAFDIGIQTQIFSQLGIALVAKNPIPFSEKLAQTFPSVFKLGLCYDAGERWQLQMEINKGTRFPPQILFGIEYAPSKSIFLRTGFDLGTDQWTIGISYAYQKIKIHASSIYHLSLGFSPAVGFQTQF